MEVIIALAVIAGLCWWFWNTSRDKKKSQDLGTHYKVEAANPESAPAAAPAWHTAPPEGTKPLAVPNPLDVNGDGKVNMDDVKEVVKKTRTRAKKVAEAVETAAKPKVKKTATKTVAKTATKTATSKVEAATKPAKINASKSTKAKK